MAENTAQGQTSPEVGTPAAGAPTGIQGTQPTGQQEGAPSPALTPQRPEFIPEKFWDAQAGKPRTDALAKSYSELEARYSKVKDETAKEVTAQIQADLAKKEAERRAQVPPKPEAYKIAPPEDVSDVVFLEKQPDASFRFEPGKTYAVINKDDKLFQAAANLAHKYGVPQAEFSAVVAELGRSVGYRPPTEEEITKQREQVYTKLGENGAQRADFAWKGLKAALGDKAAALDSLIDSAEGVEAVEMLLEKAGQARFTTGSATPPAQYTETQLRQMVGDPRYLKDPAYRQAVDAAFKAFYGD